MGPFGGSAPLEGSSTRSEPEHRDCTNGSTPAVDEVYPRRGPIPNVHFLLLAQRGVLALDGDQMRVPVRAPPLPTSASTRALSLAWRAICTAHVPVARPSDGLRNRESKGRQAPHPSGRHQKAKACLLCSEFGNITLIRPGPGAQQQQQHRARGRSATPHSPVASSRFRHRGSAPVSGEGPLPAPASLWSVSVACFARASDLPVTLLSCGRRAVR